MIMIMHRIAPELAGPCRELIAEHHQHLADASIAYIFRSGKWITKGATQLGKAIVAPAVWRTLSDYDLVLVVNEQAYRAQTDEGKTAMLDNLLCYFSPPAAGPDGNNYSTREPDIQEFSDIVRRRKVCFSNLPALDEGPGHLKRIEFEPPNNDEVIEEIDGIEDDEEGEDLFIIEDYEDIDDTGCTVTPLISFEK